MDQQSSERGIVLSAEQKSRRRSRSIALAVALAVFVALIFAVTLVKGPGVMIRPL
ncbi:MAG: CoxF protein [Hyphomicrobiales bacterium]|nr:CoxF protein [Alphaproteobacteria bacterium]